MSELTGRCKQALELTCLFAITTPNMYPRSTVEAVKVHTRFCAACTTFLREFGVRRVCCRCSFCSSATPVLNALSDVSKPLSWA